MNPTRLLFFGGFIGVPGLLILGGIISILRHRATKGWPAVEGRVTFAEIKGGSDGWDCRVKYAYSVEGREYRGRKILRDHIQEGTLEEARAHPDAYRTGGAITVRYNPAKPAGHFVHRESLAGPAAMLGFGLVVLLVDFVIFVALGVRLPE